MTRLALVVAIAACSPALAPPIAAHPPARPRGSYARVALDNAHWKLVGRASAARDTIQLHFGCSWDDEAAHVLDELDRPGLWTIAVHRRPTTCERGYWIQLNPPGHEYTRIAYAEFSEGAGGIAIELDQPGPIELRIYALGGVGCCGVATFDRVEVARIGDR